MRDALSLCQRLPVMKTAMFKEGFYDVSQNWKSGEREKWEKKKCVKKRKEKNGKKKNVGKCYKWGRGKKWKTLEIGVVFVIFPFDYKHYQVILFDLTDNPVA